MPDLIIAPPRICPACYSAFEANYQPGKMGYLFCDHLGALGGALGIFELIDGWLPKWAVYGPLTSEAAQSIAQAHLEAKRGKQDEFTH